MTGPQLLNEPVSVEALINNNRLAPQTIIWRDRPYTVISVGRQWAEQEATHVLVELHDGSRMEIGLVYLPALHWRVQRFWPPLLVA